MMEWSDAMLMAYVDGELDADTAARLTAVLASRPDLALQVKALRDVRRTVAQAYTPILDEPTPARLTALLAEPAARNAEVVDLAARRAKTSTPYRAGKRRIAPWMAMAAAAVAAILLTTHETAPLAGNALVALKDGAPVASGPLRVALETRLASDAQDGPVRVGVTFAAADGYCRSFTAEGRATLSGIACRDGGAWKIALLERAETSKSVELRTASGLSPALAAAIEARSTGDTLNAAAERAARDNGWKL